MGRFDKILAVGALALSPALHSGPAHAQPAAAPQELRIVEGERLPLGEGTAVAWVTLDMRGTPVSVGVSITEAALHGLPHQDQEVTLALPPEARLAGYDHVGLNWNPHGHEPPGIYDAPHFDAHFYRITMAEWAGIVPDDPHYEAKLAKPPAAGHMPSGFAKAPGGVPRMGAHWPATDAPEFAGGRFERTMILGSYDGRLIFLEPMMTRAFLLTRPDVTIPVRAPERAVGTLWWPDAYSVSFRDGVHRVALTGLRPLPER